MTVTINSIEEMIAVSRKRSIPTCILEDVDKRVTDWLASGGSLEDPYIKQQFRFVENYVNSNYTRGRVKKNGK